MARGTLLALNNSAMYLGATVGATVMGVAIERGGFVGAGALAAAVVMTAGLITKLWVRERATE
jgi:predicted MFS family arabinose efflux permease